MSRKQSRAVIKETSNCFLLLYPNWFPTSNWPVTSNSAVNTGRFQGLERSRRYGTGKERKIRAKCGNQNNNKVPMPRPCLHWSPTLFVLGEWAGLIFQPRAGKMPWPRNGTQLACMLQPTCWTARPCSEIPGLLHPTDYLPLQKLKKMINKREDVVSHRPEFIPSSATRWLYESGQATQP